MTVSKRFNMLGILEDLVPLWDAFKSDTLEAGKECIRERASKIEGWLCFGETLVSIEESCADRFAENRNQYRLLSRKTGALQRRDEERYVRSI